MDEEVHDADGKIRNGNCAHCSVDFLVALGATFGLAEYSASRATTDKDTLGVHLECSVHSVVGYGKA